MLPCNRTFHARTSLPLLGVTALLALPASDRSPPPGSTTETCDSTQIAPARRAPDLRTRRRPLQTTDGEATVRITTPNSAGVTLWARTAPGAALLQLADHELMLAPRLQVPAGRIELCAQGPYHSPRCIIVDLAAGETFEATWHLDLRPAEVLLDGVPSGCELHLDGHRIATTPLTHALEIRARSPTILEIVTPDDTHHSAFLPSVDPGEVHTLHWSDVVTEERR
jgi:hypothetical protein